jgi:hypothetical protein
LFSGVFFGLDFSSVLPGDPFAYIGWAVTKFDALRLAGAKESDRLYIHQRYFGQL